MCPRFFFFFLNSAINIKLNLCSRCVKPLLTLLPINMPYVGTTQLFHRRYEIYGIAMEICELVTRDLSSTSSLKTSTVCTNTIVLPQSANIWSKQKKTSGISKTVTGQSRDGLALATTFSHYTTTALVCVCVCQK